MKIKLPPLTKAEKIMGILNYWDPDNRKARGYHAYNYEAETIAQYVRVNSRTETVIKAIYEAFDCELKENEVKAAAQYILMTIKK